MGMDMGLLDVIFCLLVSPLFSLPILRIDQKERVRFTFEEP